MAAPNTIINKLNKLKVLTTKPIIYLLLERALNTLTAQIEEAQRDQMLRSKTRTGDSMPFYKDEKYNKGKKFPSKTGRYNLKKDGVLHKNVKVKVSKNALTISAERKERSFDVAEYWEEKLKFLGLNQSTLNDLLPLINQRLQIEIIKFINK
jgi:hypothetical protein